MVLSGTIVLALGVAGLFPYDGTWSHEDAQVTLLQVGPVVNGSLLKGKRHGSIAATVMGAEVVGKYELNGRWGDFRAMLANNGMFVYLDGEREFWVPGPRRHNRPRKPAPAPVQLAPEARAGFQGVYCWRGSDEDARHQDPAGSMAFDGQGKVRWHPFGKGGADGAGDEAGTYKVDGRIVTMSWGDDSPMRCTIARDKRGGPMLVCGQKTWDLASCE